MVINAISEQCLVWVLVWGMGRLDHEPGAEWSSGGHGPVSASHGKQSLAHGSLSGQVDHLQSTLTLQTIHFLNININLKFQNIQS